MPYFHLMGLAPLDIWWRLLRRPPASIPPPYWPRLVAALATASGATALTLPERVLYALWTRLRPPASQALLPPLFVLGYYRSGTTHLQYILDCDPQLYSPKSFQTLAPQGFLLTWLLLRLILIPFLPSQRVQDAMRFGANAPSEDDFALNNWALASTLAGRAIVPGLYPFYARFHDLARLDAAERARWRRTQTAFVHKLALWSRRRVLLKTPSHTARIPTLLELFPNARFVHISRDPEAVVHSNVALLRLAQTRYCLQAPLSRDHLQAVITDEYIATETRYLETRELIPAGRRAETRYEDLVADPLGEVRRIYDELGLQVTPVFEQKLRAYLASTRDYRTAAHQGWTEEARQRLQPRLAPLAAAFGHERPPVPRVAPPAADAVVPPMRVATVALAVAAICASLWLLCVSHLQQRTDTLVWPTGLAIGLATRRAAGSCSLRLGLCCAALTLSVLLAAATATTWTLGQAGTLLWSATLRHLTVEARLFWSLMGVVSAYKLAAHPYA